MRVRHQVIAAMVTVCVGAIVPPRLLAENPPPTQSQAEFFEKRVRPVLVERCFECHGPKKQEAGLRLDSREAILKGAETGPVVEPGKPDESLLIEAIQHTGAVKMPPKSKLGDTQIADLTEWVRQGVPFPAAAKVATSKAAANHWAFQPVRNPPLPAVKDEAWARSPIDRFILARLEAEGLSPAGTADKQTLLRRASFVLTGLPPSPEQQAEFESDTDPKAFETLVDRLLASPRYGERWARHWLDVSRYADNKGYVFFEEQRFPWAYTYRDYVIRAFNEDLPYDRFLLEQLAADQLELGNDRRPLTALGFLTLGGHFMNNVHDILDDRIDVVTRGLQGLTVTCARCHDHKFDPIPTADYYSLYGVFRSSAEPMLPPLFETPPETEEYKKFEAEMQNRLKKLDEFVQQKHRELVESAQARMAEYLIQAQATRDQPSTEGFMLLNNPGDLHPTVSMRWWVLLDKTRRRPDPVWAAWHRFAALPAAEFSERALEVCAELRSSGLKDGLPHNPLVVTALTEPPPQSLTEVAERYAKLVQETNAQWLAAKQPAEGLPDPAREQVRGVFHAEDAPSNVPLASGWGFLTLLPDRPAQGEYQKLLKEVEQWSMTGAGAPARAMVLFDTAQPYEPRIFQRGNPNRPGAAVPRQFVSIANPNRQPFAKGSGRLELAQQIASRANPLTARVLVNRVWMHHFGSGLVRTPGDFGLRSEPPSHPELLDWLATRFMDRGWSIKALQRDILLSAVWQQAGHHPGEAVATARDPENRLLWHRPPQRLDFEATRDALYSVSGSLDLTLGGPAVDFFAQPPRRSVYGSIDRLNIQSLLRTFDVPSPDATSPQRDQTTIAGQALFLMNGPVAQECAAKLLARSDVSSVTEFTPRVDRLCRILFARPSRPDDRQVAETFFGSDPAGRQDPEQWQRYVHGLLMTNEFAFVD